jgi:hypothetical protein
MIGTTYWRKNLQLFSSVLIEESVPIGKLVHHYLIFLQVELESALF